NMVQSLPEGYRMVFNLYVIEGYKHNEIAEMLKISENTSKSQLAKARKSLQITLKEKYYETTVR
ncbi:MAG: sigma-70 region 4 domain-containing protein, partial [Bacteroidia bacterium]|nr:sigma-70 region 4 domain-containing protein [Bacteroidia bacterium]